MAKRSVLSIRFVATSFALAVASFLVGLVLAVYFDFPAKFLFVGLAFVHALEARGVTITNRPALPVSFLAWWLVLIFAWLIVRSWRERQRTA